MHRRHHAQRQHIIYSLDSLLYQLHTLSFFLSPTIWLFGFRLISQVNFAKPRDIDPTRSLRFHFGLVFVFSALGIWTHAVQGAAEGRGIILDFIGLAYVPSKTQLITLDLLIMFLQFLLTTIAYETSLTGDPNSNTIDILAPPPISPTPSPSISSAIPISMSDQPKAPPRSTTEPSYIIDLRLAPLLTRLRSSPPTPPDSNDPAGLPLPNTTPPTWPVPTMGMRMLMMMGEAGPRPSVDNPSAGSRRLPGGMDDSS